VTPEEKALLEALDEKRRLERKAKRKLRALLNELGRAEQQRKAQILIELQNFPDEIKSSVLLEVLSHSSAEVRAYAAHELGRIKYSKALQSLLRLCLTDASPQVREAALGALRTINSPHICPLLLPYLEHTQSIVRYRAACLLYEFGDRRAVKSLVDALEDSFRMDANTGYVEFYEAQPRAPGEEQQQQQTRRPPQRPAMPPYYVEKRTAKELSPPPRVSAAAMQKAILRALKKITGVNFGLNTRLWYFWLELQQKRGKKSD
jgi:HEAT repeat protein